MEVKITVGGWRYGLMLVKNLSGVITGICDFLKSFIFKPFLYLTCKLVNVRQQIVTCFKNRQIFIQSQISKNISRYAGLLK